MNVKALLTKPGWLDSVLGFEALADVTELERIGEQFGFSGEIYRLHMSSEAFMGPSIIIKLEHIDRHRRAVNAYRAVNHALGTHMPAIYGSAEEGDTGVLLMQDIERATQGDDSLGCSEPEARQVVDLIATLHETTSGANVEEAEVWGIRPAPDDIWMDRLARATARYPDLATPEISNRLKQFPDEIARAGEALSAQTVSWIHVDPHLDNVLWDEDGEPVLVDWSNARIGPPTVDVAALLIGYAFAQPRSIDPDLLLEHYGRRREIEYGNVVRDVTPALVTVVQGLIGWAGEDSNDGFASRKLKLRDTAVGRAVRALEYIDQ